MYSMGGMEFMRCGCGSSFELEAQQVLCIKVMIGQVLLSIHISVCVGVRPGAQQVL